MTPQRTLTIALIAIGVPMAANAQTPGKRTYVRVSAGVNMMPKEHVEAGIEAGQTPLPAGEELTAAGPVVAGAFGWAVHPHLRVEAEGTFRSNRITGESGLGDSAGGVERKSGVMGNVLYEFPGARVRPYAGGGLGAQFVHEPDAVTTAAGIVVDVALQAKASFAYQAIAGAAFPVSNAFSMTAEYRYLALGGTRVYSGTATIPGVGVLPFTDRSSDNRNHSLMFGVRYGW